MNAITPTTHLRALTVVGQSMYSPTGSQSYNDGDVLYIDPQKQPVNGSFVVAKSANADVEVFRQLTIGSDGKRYLKALNPSWPEPITPMNPSASISGVVVYKVTGAA